MTGRGVRGPEATSKKDRRSPGGHRVLFEAMVAVGGGEGGGGFEAESVDVSSLGMRLRTAYLPGVGDSLVCRFDGPDGEIVAMGEVMWTTEQARGGEFALRFVDLDEETAEALRQLSREEPARDEPEPPAQVIKGTRVKLHIEGLASPMKARVRQQGSSEISVGSSLEFLRLGRQVEVEDVEQGARREGFVDGVRVEVDPGTSVPQLVVSLRFDGALVQGARAVHAAPAPKPAPAPEPPAAADAAPPTKAARDVTGEADEASAAPAAEAQATAPTDEELQAELGLPSAKLRAARDRAAQITTAATAAVVPALSKVGASARGLLSSMRSGIEKRRKERREAAKANAPRRVTAPPPSGALTSAGKRLVRQDVGDEAPASDGPPKRSSKRGVVIGAIAGLSLVAGAFGVAKAVSGNTETQSTPVTAADVRANKDAPALPPIPGAPAVAEVPLYGATPLSTTEQVTPPPPGSGVAVVDPTEPSEDAPSKDLVREWGHGEVSKAKVLKIKMDGPVEGFSAAESDGGFTLTVPGRKSLSTSTALVRKDKRIAALDVIPREEATEINVRFKGDAPPYLVKVRSDRIEIALGADEADKKSEDKKKVASKKKSTKKGDKKK